MPTYGLGCCEVRSMKKRKRKLPKATTARASPMSEIGLRNHSRSLDNPVTVFGVPALSVVTPCLSFRFCPFAAAGRCPCNSSWYLKLDLRVRFQFLFSTRAALLHSSLILPIEIRERLTIRGQNLAW